MRHVIHLAILANTNHTGMMYLDNLNRISTSAIASYV